MREKSLTHVIMKHLSHRMVLEKRYRDYLWHLDRGDDGELIWDGLASCLDEQCLVINGILLQPHFANAFQLDAIILVGRVFHVYEIKNYAGEYSYGPEIWTKPSGFKRGNPQIQMADNKNNFISLMGELGYDKDFKVESHTVLIDPEFTLHYAPAKGDLLLASQLRQHFARLENNAPPPTDFTRQVVRNLLAHQGKPKVFWHNVPEYNYDSLKKGVYCQECGSYELEHYRQSYCCMKCGEKNTSQFLIETNINELKVLFPDCKITSRMVYDWCGKVYSQKRIRRVIVKMPK